MPTSPSPTRPRRLSTVIFPACVCLWFTLVTGCDIAPPPADDAPAQDDRARALADSLENGGFERGLRGWRNSSDNRMSLPNREAARAGKRGLRVTDQDTTLRSRLRSEPVRVAPGQVCRLGFDARILSDGGINVYLEFLDAKRERIQLPGGERIHVLLPDAPSDWKRYELTHPAPPGSTAVVVVVQSNGRARVTADFDGFDLRIGS